MDPLVANQTGIIVVENAKRLHEDAELLHDMDRFPTSYSVSILAQEEFGKAFMLHLVADEALPWTEGLEKALKSHSCKQLVALIMEYLQRDDDYWLDSQKLEKRYEEDYRGVRKLPRSVIDAVHIIVHEHTRQLNRYDWADSDRPIDPQASRIAKGVLDREKQAGFYVSLGPNGMITRAPHLIMATQSKAELEKTEKVSKAIWAYEGKLEAGAAVEVHKITALFQVLAGTMSLDEFNSYWW